MSAVDAEWDDVDCCTAAPCVVCSASATPCRICLDLFFQGCRRQAEEWSFALLPGALHSKRCCHCKPAHSLLPADVLVLPSFRRCTSPPVCREAADRLYAKSKTLQTAATVYMTAAQALLADNDMQGYKDKKAAADKVRAESKAAFEEAQRLSWSANNKAQQTWQADLHGLAVHVALRKFVSQFEMLAAMDCPGGVLYKVIVGKGKHSEDNVPKIKLGVLQYLEEKAEQVLGETGEPWPVQWQIDPCNEGLLCVYIPGGCRRDGAGAGDVE